MATYKFVRKKTHSSVENPLPASEETAGDILSVFLASADQTESKPAETAEEIKLFEETQAEEETVVSDIPDLEDTVISDIPDLKDTFVSVIPDLEDTADTADEHVSTVIVHDIPAEEKTVVFKEIPDLDDDKTIVVPIKNAKDDGIDALLDWRPDPSRKKNIDDLLFDSGFIRPQSVNTAPLFTETIDKESLRESTALSVESMPEISLPPQEEPSLDPPVFPALTSEKEDIGDLFESENTSEKDTGFSALRSFFLRKEEPEAEKTEVFTSDTLDLFSADDSAPIDNAVSEDVFDEVTQKITPDLSSCVSVETIDEAGIASNETVDTEKEVSIESEITEEITLTEPQQETEEDNDSVSEIKKNKESVVDAFLKMYATSAAEEKVETDKTLSTEKENVSVEGSVFSPAAETLDDSSLRTIADIFGGDLYEDQGDAEEIEPVRKNVRPENSEAAFLHYGQEEYTSPEQADEVSERIRSRGAKHLADFIFCAIYTLLLFYIESGIFSRPKFLQPGTFGIFMLLVDSLLLILTTIQIFPILQDGITALKHKSFTPNTLTAFIFITCIVHLLFNWLSPYNADMLLFSSVGALSAASASLVNLLQSKQHYLAFRVLASGKQKLAAILDEDGKVTLKKVDFISNFIQKTNQTPRLYRTLGFTLLASLLFAVIFAIWGGTQSAGGGLQRVIGGSNIFLVTLLLTSPLSSLFAIIVPYYRLSRKMSRNESALLSLDALDKLTGTRKLSFSDADLFPQKGVTLASIRTYGNHQIDQTLLYAARIFRRCGGTLSRVFEESLQNLSATVSDETFPLSIRENGISTQIGGKEILVGSKEFMIASDFGYIKDDIDDTFENSMGRIMYMTVGDEIAAKFYIRYNPSRAFERLLRGLDRDGIETVICTRDPNLSDAFLAKLMKKNITRLHTCQLPLEDEVLPSVDSDLVSTASVSGVLRSFFICRQLRQRIRWNNLLRLLTVTVGALVALLLALNGSLSALSPLFIFVYQLMWLLPVTVPAFME